MTLVVIAATSCTADDSATEDSGASGGTAELAQPLIIGTGAGECTVPEIDVTTSVQASDPDGPDEPLSTPQIVEQVAQGVVVVTAIAPASAADTGAGDDGDEDDVAAASTGSGAVVDDEGLIVTNRHVVEGAEGVVVQGFDGRNREAAIVAVLGGDNDLAALRVTDTDGLVPVELGSSFDTGLGATVVAIGSPKSIGLSVSAGILSAKGRNLEVDGADLYDLLQTDAAINTGNSGGPLLDDRGRLIGLNTAVIEAENVGFAIPVEQVRAFLDAARAGESIPRIGAKLTTMTAKRIANSGAPVGAGVGVDELDDAGPAVDAGLVEGDVITAADGVGLSSATQMNQAIADADVGGTIDLLVCHRADDGTWGDREIALVVGGQDISAN